MNREEVLTNIKSKEKTEATIWIVIAVIQIIVGIMNIAFYWMALILGIYNLVNAMNEKKEAEKIEERSDNIVEEYEKDLTNLIVTMFINLFIGGVIGVIGGIYAMTIRSYVLKNKDIIMGTASEGGDKYEKLAKLQELKNSGTISEMEFEVEKSKILR